jgi:hypothetical protein
MRFDMAKVFVLRDGFLDRVRKMSGLKTEEALAGALHVSVEELQAAESSRNPSPNILVGLFNAFGFTPGEATVIEERVLPRSQKLVA